MSEHATFIVLVWAHFVGDFILQSDKVALAKSSSVKTLALHVAIYTAMFVPWGLRFCVVTYIAHFLTDFVSSRLTSYFWKNEKRHWFFVTIGADQALHLTALAAAYEAFK